MAQLTRRIAAIAAVGAFSLPAAAGQEEQFTPEFKEVRSSFDAKHTPKLSAPKVTFTIALDSGGVLRALAEPTHSAAWEASRKIKVAP